MQVVDRFFGSSFFQDRPVLELILERSVITAPITGYALDRLVEPGEVVSPGAGITTLQKIDRLKVSAAVPDTEISWLREGGRGSVSVDAWPGREFHGKIGFLSPSADAESRTFTIELELANQKLELRPGMVARVKLDRRNLDSAVAVPVDALVTRVEGQVAFVVEDCRAVMRNIRAGGIEGGLILIEEGLKPGDLLVVEGQRDLADGQKVSSEECR